MNLLTKEIEKKLPALGSQESVADPVVVVKYFATFSDWKWYGIEFCPKTRTFFGFVHGFEDELGYFSLNELEAVKGPLGLGIERDLYWTPVPLSEVKAGRAR